MSLYNYNVDDVISLILFGQFWPSRVVFYYVLWSMSYIILDFSVISIVACCMSEHLPLILYFWKKYRLYTKNYQCNSICAGVSFSYLPQYLANKTLLFKQLEA